jgi:hypothetical protein
LFSTTIAVSVPISELSVALWPWPKTGTEQTCLPRELRSRR